MRLPMISLMAATSILGCQSKPSLDQIEPDVCNMLEIQINSLVPAGTITSGYNCEYHRVELTVSPTEGVEQLPNDIGYLAQMSELMKPYCEMETPPEVNFMIVGKQNQLLFDKLHIPFMCKGKFYDEIIERKIDEAMAESNRVACKEAEEFFNDVTQTPYGEKNILKLNCSSGQIETQHFLTHSSLHNVKTSEFLKQSTARLIRHETLRNNCLQLAEDAEFKKTFTDYGVTKYSITVYDYKGDLVHQATTDWETCTE